MKILVQNLGERVTSAVTYSPMRPSLARITLPRTHYSDSRLSGGGAIEAPYLTHSAFDDDSVASNYTKLGCCLNHRVA